MTDAIDLIERLRRPIVRVNAEVALLCEAAIQAADEIERLTKSEQIEAQIEARDALLDFISENGTASEGVQHYLDRYVRAALAAKEQK